jgi:hypothetical protein
MPTPLVVALASGTGGIAPSLVHLAQGFLKQSPDVPGLFYFVGVGIFFVLGCLVACFFAETNAKKAFFLGIGLPALIATAQTQGPPKNLVEGLIPPAYAQALPASSAKPDALRFRPITDCKECEVWFADRDGRIISKQMVEPSQRVQAIEVPKGAAAVGVSDPKTNFELFQLPRPGDVPPTITFDRKYSPLKDLRRGLGDYNIRSYDSELKLAK